MKIAVAGKGGAGKTTWTATASRLLARAGRRVIAIDGDTNPNLAPALGNADAPAAGFTPLPSSLVSRRLDGPPALTVTIDELIEAHGTVAPDGVSVMRLGAPEHPDEGCLCSAHAVVSAMLAVLGELDDVAVVLDLEASPEHLGRGTARHADVLVLVAEPYFRSLEAVRRQAEIASRSSIGSVVVIANKVRSADDHAAIEQFCERHDLTLVGVLPWSDAALDADAAGRALLDHAPDDPLVAAIAATASTVSQVGLGSFVGGAPLGEQV